MHFQGNVKQCGKFPFEVRRSGLLVAKGEFDNGMTTVGLTALASTELGGGTQYTTWYMGLISNSGYSALAVGDTASSHSGWTELASYDEATRPSLTFGAAAGGIIATSSVCTFTISATVAIKGAFIISNSTKSGTTGILRATGIFSSVQNLADNDVLTVNYSSTFS